MTTSIPVHAFPRRVRHAKPARLRLRVAGGDPTGTDPGRPVVPAETTSATVRALTKALAPHLSTADPELHGLAATLLSSQHAYAQSMSAAPGTDRDEVRRRYADAARDYCAALDRRGFAPPPGLPDAVRWLSASGE